MTHVLQTVVFFKEFGTMVLNQLKCTLSVTNSHTTLDKLSCQRRDNILV